MDHKLLINEIFGPTIQGEGRFAGQRCAFVRLAICPLRCRWCDTAYTWAFSDALAARHQAHRKYEYEEEVHEMSVGDIVSHVNHSLNGSNLVILSGGEPLAQTPIALQKPDVSIDDLSDPIGRLAHLLAVYGVRMHVETAGIRRPSPYLDRHVGHYIVSPKLATSGNVEKARRQLGVLMFFAESHKADFKFVVTEPEDFSEISLLANLCSIPRDRIWVMPEGTSAEELQRKMPMVAERAVKFGYNVSTRLHVLIWGDERKR